MAAMPPHWVLIHDADLISILIHILRHGAGSASPMVLNPSKSRNIDLVSGCIASLRLSRIRFWFCWLLY